MKRRARAAALRGVGVAATLALATAAAAAADSATLRGDIVVSHDALTLGDLIANVPSTAAETPLFRAPALGQTGTIQTRRILAAATAAGVSVETGGRLQVVVTRAAREVGTTEIEAAIKKTLERTSGLDGRAVGISFEGTPPSLLLSPDSMEAVTASDVAYDRRSRRVVATVWVGPNANERRASTRVVGSVVELVDVAVLTRPLARGDTVGAADVTIEHRARDAVPPDALLDGAPLAGRVARRAFTAGALVRTGDLMRPELVARGDIVTVVYESPGIVLSMRAKAQEGGANGDTVTLVNATSKKTLQGVVIGAGKVSVNAAVPGRVAVATPAAAAESDR